MYDEHTGGVGVNPVDSRQHYLTLRAGTLGVCGNEQSGGLTKAAIPISRNLSLGNNPHMKPCLADIDCNNVQNSCIPLGKRCTNNPRKAPCTSDSDCVMADWCDPATNKCKYDLLHGSFADMARPITSQNPNPMSRSCNPANMGTDCLPASVHPCQPIVLRVEGTTDVNSNVTTITKAWDLNWDPDENVDLLNLPDGVKNYLGDPNIPATLANKLAACLTDYWFLTDLPGNGAQHQPKWRSPVTTVCPWGEPASP